MFFRCCVLRPANCTVSNAQCAQPSVMHSTSLTLDKAARNRLMIVGLSPITIRAHRLAAVLQALCVLAAEKADCLLD